VQIVEVTETAVRVAELQLERRQSPLRFVLYPMLHVGSPEFYAEVSRRLRDVDAVVAEGGDDSRAAWTLTAGYRALVDDTRRHLMLQHLDYPSTGAEIVRPDLQGEGFDARWLTVPRWQRALARGATGVAVAGQAAFGERWLQLVLEHAKLDDLPTNEETLTKDPLPDIERVVMDERDERLVAALADLHERRHDEQVTVAITYGAAHVRAVVSELNRRFGYRVRAGEWLTVLRRP
jgi:hypothetical protein